MLLVEFTPERDTVVIPVGMAIPGPVDTAIVVEAAEEVALTASAFPVGRDVPEGIGATAVVG
jgi:hypothetical protein